MKGKLNFVSSRDAMVHYSHELLIAYTACGADLSMHDMQVTDRDVDCMACIAVADEPSIEDKMAAALGVPKEFLYGGK